MLSHFRHGQKNCLKTKKSRHKRLNASGSQVKFRGPPNWTAKPITFNREEGKTLSVPYLEKKERKKPLREERRYGGFGIIDKTFHWVNTTNQSNRFFCEKGVGEKRFADSLSSFLEPSLVQWTIYRYLKLSPT